MCSLVALLRSPQVWGSRSDATVAPRASLGSVMEGSLPMSTNNNTAS